MLAWWLLAAAAGQNAYGTFEAFATSWFGRLVLFGFTWALLHHLLGGIRYFVWDLGYGFGPEEREWLVRANLVGSIACDRAAVGRLRDAAAECDEGFTRP